MNRIKGFIIILLRNKWREFKSAVEWIFLEDVYSDMNIFSPLCFSDKLYAKFLCSRFSVFIQTAIFLPTIAALCIALLLGSLALAGVIVSTFAYVVHDFKSLQELYQAVFGFPFGINDSIKEIKTWYDHFFVNMTIGIIYSIIIALAIMLSLVTIAPILEFIVDNVKRAWRESKNYGGKNNG